MIRCESCAFLQGGARGRLEGPRRLGKETQGVRHQAQGLCHQAPDEGELVGLLSSARKDG